MVNVTGLRGISASKSLPGIRPVLIWKSTAAAPAPTRLGPAEVPWAFIPWQEEQVSAKIALP